MDFNSSFSRAETTVDDELCAGDEAGFGVCWSMTNTS
jgi:hypothetical protein